MKKLLAVFTLLAVILTQTAVFADDGLIFDMDLSEYSETNRVVRNKANSSDAITVYGNGDNFPHAGAVSSMNGDLPCITTGEGKNLQYGMISVTGASANAMGTADSLSFEIWTKSGTPSAAYRNYLMFGLADSSGIDDVSLKMHNDGVELMSGSRSLTEIDDYEKDKWQHWVITRSSKPNEEDEGFHFEYNVYLNGASKGTFKGGAKLTDTAYTLSIGAEDNLSSAKIYNGSFGGFKVYTKELTATEVSAIYAKEKTNYEELPSTMELVSPTAAKELKKTDKELEVEFNNYIDKATLENGLKLLNKSDESEFSGAVMQIPEGNTKKVTFKLNGLNEGDEFILRISGVQSVNHKTVTAQDIAVTVYDSAIMSEDFSDWTVGEVNASEHSDFVFYSSGTSNSADDFEVKQRGTVKYIEGKNSNNEAAKDTYIAYNMPSSTYGKDFCLEIAVKGEGEATSRSIRAVDGGTHYEIALSASGSSWGSSQNGAGLDKVISSYSTSVEGSDGFFHLLFTFVCGEDGKYTVYGTSPDNSGVNYEAKTKFEEITQIRLFNQYNKGSDSVTTGVGAFKIYEYVTPKISKTNLSEIKKDSDYITVTFDDDMTGFTGESFTLRKQDGTAVEAEYESYDENARTAKIKLGEYLDYGASYTLTADGPKSASGNAMRASSIDFTVPQNDVNATVTFGEGTVTAVIKNNKSGPASVLLSVVMYDADGKLLKTDSKTLTVDNQNTQKITLEEGTAKTLVYLFENIGGEYRATTAKAVSPED